MLTQYFTPYDVPKIRYEYVWRPVRNPKTASLTEVGLDNDVYDIRVMTIYKHHFSHAIFHIPFQTNMNSNTNEATRKSYMSVPVNCIVCLYGMT